MQRALPPTPSLQPRRLVQTDSHSLLDSKYESVPRREQHSSDELARCKKALAARETEITNLKTIVYEWKKKAVDWEKAHTQLQDTLREREHFLAVQHTAELKALTKAHARQTNEVLESVVHLQNENKRLQEKCEAKATSDTLVKQGEDDPCATAEQAHRTTSNSVLYGRKKMDVMALNINDMVNMIEVELQRCKRGYDVLDESHLDAEHVDSDSPADQESIASSQSQSLTPPLSESSQSSSSEENNYQDSKRLYRHRSQAMDNLAKMVIPNFLRASKSKATYGHLIGEVRPEREEEQQIQLPPTSKTSPQRPLSTATSQLMQHYQLYQDGNKQRHFQPKRQSYVPINPTRLSAIHTSSSASASEQWQISDHRLQAPIS